MNGRAIALRAISAAVLAACMVAPAFAVDGKASIDLEENRIGVPPLDDFDFGVTGGGQPGQWTVVRDVTAIDGVAIEQSNTDPTEQRRIFAQCRVCADLIVIRCISRKNLPQAHLTKDRQSGPSTRGARCQCRQIERPADAEFGLG